MPRLTCFALLILAANTRAENPSTPTAPLPWKFDTVQLKNGAVLRGLLGDETPTGTRFQNVRRQPGRPTVVFPTTLKHAEIARIERLNDEDRKVLQERLRELEQNGPQAEKERLDALVLESIAWAPEKTGAWRYTSDYFVLTSNAPEEIVRRAALRLEQISTAYGRHLPARHKGGAATSILLITDLAEYRRHLADRKQPFLNLAFYDPSANRIVCASDLKDLGARLADVKTKHRQLRQELERLREEYSRLYKGKELAAYIQAIKARQEQIARADLLNEQLFDGATRLLFSTLYHEAFHAYVANFVYPPQTAELPRWLNEGLAQIFETALVEAGELRIGHADAARLARAKDLLKKNGLIPLSNLITSGPKQFLLAHTGDRQVSDLHYVTSWAVAHYLTFERRLFGAPAMDKYVQALHDGRDARSALEDLVGQPLPAFDADFRKFLAQLQADGSTR